MTRGCHRVTEQVFDKWETGQLLRNSGGGVIVEAHSVITSAASLASSTVVFHDETLIRIAVPPSHWVGPHQIRPSR